MHKLFTVLILTCFINVVAQSITPLFKNDSSKLKSFTAFGEMFFQGTILKGTFSGAYGGKAGFIFNRAVAFGGMGINYLMTKDFIGNNFYGNSNAHLDLRLSAGGFFFQYINQLWKPVHFSVPINLLIGQASVTDETGRYVESARAFIIEPGINLEFNFTRILIIGVTVGYRIARLNKLTNISHEDIDGFAFGLSGKFGKF